ncbi:ethanolaminephosphotransferase 1 isoform X2 [Culicoides brevitarsis]|uniref:ethanolaminephosphotransferase 1 isoform X2 n=1 Tax=Culicoides brevitarsis TaxID=469753 RepID=UPI00307BB3C4
MLGIKYLSEAHLKGFDKYKYNCVDKSWFSNNVMHPFWNKCVTYFPRWLAPNLITFSGFLLTILNFFLIAYYDYDFHAADAEKYRNEPNPIPRWVWLVAGINLFVAYTLDGIDGKQARRTGTSSPLGELFDHGLDSYSTSIIHIYMFSLFGRQDFSPIRMHFIVIAGVVNFYITHFEKYNTGIMYLPIAYDYVMCSVCLSLAFTTIIGPWIWTTEYFGILPRQFFEVLLYTSGPVTSWWVTGRNIYLGYKNKTGKMRPFWEAARPLMPLSYLIFITTIWAFFSVNEIIMDQPRLFFILTGTLFSNICCRLIVAQMSDTVTERFNALLYPTTLCVIVSCFPYALLNLQPITLEVERWIIYVLTGFVTLAHIHYGAGVVCEMCDHFKIRCFKVTSVQPVAVAVQAVPAPVSESMENQV